MAIAYIPPSCGGHDNGKYATEEYVNSAFNGDSLKITFTDEEMMEIASLGEKGYMTISSVPADLISAIVDSPDQYNYARVIINNQFAFNIVGMGGVHDNDVDTGRAITMQQVEMRYSDPSYKYSNNDSCVSAYVYECFIAVLRETNEVVFGNNGVYEYGFCTLSNIEQAISNIFELQDEGTLKVTLDGKTFYYKAMPM